MLENASSACQKRTSWKREGEGVVVVKLMPIAAVLTGCRMTTKEMGDGENGYIQSPAILEIVQESLQVSWQRVEVRVKEMLGWEVSCGVGNGWMDGMKIRNAMARRGFACRFLP